jgi:hypothetical protein
MKTKVEIANYEIEIEENDGVISVKAQKDDEVIEEFSIQIDGEESDDMDAEDLGSKGEIKKFDQFQGEEDDFDEGESDDDDDDDEDMDDESSFDMGDDDEEDDDMDEEEDDDQMDGDVKKLESFQHFVNKRK